MANTLGLSNADATHELLLEVLSRRLKGWTSAQVLQAVTSDEPVFSWKIVYARRELIRKHFKSVMKEHYKAEQLKAGLEPSESTIDLTRDGTNDDIAQALKLELLPRVFANHGTAAWVAYLLQFGQQETMAHFHQSPRQFKQKLNRVCKLATARQIKSIGLLSSKQDKNLLNQLKTLTSFAQLLADEATTATDIQRWIASHEQYVEDIIGLTPGIKYQAIVLKHFAKASLSDQYALVNAMSVKLNRLQHKLVTR